MEWYTELYPVVLNNGSAMMNQLPEYKSMIVGLIEFVAKAVVVILVFAYDMLCLWRLASWMIKVLLKLEFESVLGTKKNVNEFHHMLGTIEGTGFKPPLQHRCYRNKRRYFFDLFGC